jgi:cyclophilin family peptidyl-prolyl cis-trans isomerase
MSNPRVKIITDKGTMIAELFEDKAPNTVANMIELAESEFYNDLRFHRILKGFMAQGGCPNTKKDAESGSPGTGGPGYTFDNEHHPEAKHDTRGILSMANAGPNTNGSQFFVCFGATPFLDGGYSVFGQVVEGLEVIDALEAVGSAQDPIPPSEKVYFSIEVESKGDKDYKVNKNG